MAAPFGSGLVRRAQRTRRSQTDEDQGPAKARPRGSGQAPPSDNGRVGFSVAGGSWCRRPPQVMLEALYDECTTFWLRIQATAASSAASLPSSRAARVNGASMSGDHADAFKKRYRSWRCNSTRRTETRRPFRQAARAGLPGRPRRCVSRRRARGPAPATYRRRPLPPTRTGRRPRQPPAPSSSWPGTG